MVPAGVDLGTLRPWSLPAGGAQRDLAVSTAAELFPVALVFPFRVAGRRWDLIAASLIAHATPQDADGQALLLRSEFSTPASVQPIVGSAVEPTPCRAQPFAALALDGCFDRGLGAYRLAAKSGRVLFRFDPRGGPRDRPTFLITGLDVGADVCCWVNGARAASDDARLQPCPADGLAPDGGLLMQLRRAITHSTLIDVRAAPDG